MLTLAGQAVEQSLFGRKQGFRIKLRSRSKVSPKSQLHRDKFVKAMKGCHAVMPTKDCAGNSASIPESCGVHMFELKDDFFHR